MSAPGPPISKSGPAWRRRRADPRSLVASRWGPEPFTGVTGHRRGSDCSGGLLGMFTITGGRSARGMRVVAAASGGSTPPVRSLPNSDCTTFSTRVSQMAVLVQSPTG